MHNDASALSIYCAKRNARSVGWTPLSHPHLLTIERGHGPSAKIRGTSPIVWSDAVKQEGDLAMRWYHYVAYFFGGAFLANTVPHFVNGVSGNAFQSPFASPPGEGLSSSTINVLWGLFNLAVAYLLICRVGTFQLRKTTHVVTLGAGVLLMSLMLARAFGRFHGGL